MVDSCRSCKSTKLREVIDLGYQPPSNAYLTKEELNRPQSFFPLKVFICEECKLVQIPEYAKAETLFTEDYAYLSSTSASWCEHAKNYVAEYSEKLNLDDTSIVVEIASNDGYLLQYFSCFLQSLILKQYLYQHQQEVIIGMKPGYFYSAIFRRVQWVQLHPPILRSTQCATIEFEFFAKN